MSDILALLNIDGISHDRAPLVLATLREVSCRTKSELFAPHVSAGESMHAKARLVFALCGDGSMTSMAAQWRALTGSDHMDYADLVRLAEGNAKESHARAYAKAFELMVSGVGITAAAKAAGLGVKRASEIAEWTGVQQWRMDNLAEDAVLCRGDGESYAEWAARQDGIGIGTLRKTWSTAGKVLAELDGLAA